MGWQVVIRHRIHTLTSRQAAEAPCCCPDRRGHESAAAAFLGLRLLLLLFRLVRMAVLLAVLIAVLFAVLFILLPMILHFVHGLNERRHLMCVNEAVLVGVCALEDPH